jgi:hypothetical protein
VLLRKIAAFQALAISASMEFAKQAPGIHFFRNSTHSETASRKPFRPPRAAQAPSVLASKIRLEERVAPRHQRPAAGGTSGIINRLNSSGVMADAGVETTRIGYTAVFYSRFCAAAEKQSHAHGASGRSSGSSLLSSAATITIRMGQAGVGAVPAGGSVTLSTVTTE